jgi:phenylalanyl-tRNA synthetase alpha subunit
MIRNPDFGFSCVRCRTITVTIIHKCNSCLYTFSLWDRRKEFTPKKYFSIDRVFRNETLDATHLAEFHQIEGLVVDKNLTLGDLMGMIQVRAAERVLPA